MRSSMCSNEDQTIAANLCNDTMPCSRIFSIDPTSRQSATALSTPQHDFCQATINFPIRTYELRNTFPTPSSNYTFLLLYAGNVGRFVMDDKSGSLRRAMANLTKKNSGHTARQQLGEGQGPMSSGKPGSLSVMQMKGTHRQSISTI